MMIKYFLLLFLCGCVTNKQLPPLPPIPKTATIKQSTSINAAQQSLRPIQLLWNWTNSFDNISFNVYTKYGITNPFIFLLNTTNTYVSNIVMSSQQYFTVTTSNSQTGLTSH